MGERDTILASADPERVFGTLEPRALRRAYARLARAWQDDDAVAGHLKALFDRARAGGVPATASTPPAPVPSTASAPTGLPTGPVPPETPRSAGEILDEAHRDGDLGGIVNALVFGYARMLHEPDRVEESLRWAIAHEGPALDRVQREQLATVIDDPRLQLSPNVEADLLQLLLTLDELEQAQHDPVLPEALVRCLRDTWYTHQPVALGRHWQRAAEALEGVHLPRVFAHLERVYPALFGRWAWLDGHLQPRGAADLPDADVLRRIWRPIDADLVVWSRLTRVAEVSPPAAWQRRFAGVACGIVLLVQGFHLLSTDDPTTQMVVLALAAPCVGYLALWGLLSRQAQQLCEEREALAFRGLDGLIVELRTRVLFPSELAQAIYDRAPRHDVPLFQNGDPLLELVRQPWVLLAAWTPAHLARLEEGP